MTDGRIDERRVGLPVRGAAVLLLDEDGAQLSEGSSVGENLGGHRVVAAALADVADEDGEVASGRECAGAAKQADREALAELRPLGGLGEVARAPGRSRS